MKRDLYAEVSARIIAELKPAQRLGSSHGRRQPARTPRATPSPIALTPVAMSSCCGWRERPVSHAAVSYVQASHGAGGNVRKGEHGTKVYFVKQLEVKDGADDNSPTRLIPMMREYTVFNVDQCEGLPDSVTTGKPMRVRNPDARDELADEFLRSTGADIREGHGEAYYVPSRDFISMPAFAAFKGADHFYNVAFHELTHWTAHKSRLDRDLKNRFGSRDYAGRRTGRRVRRRVPLRRVRL